MNLRNLILVVTMMATSMVNAAPSNEDSCYGYRNEQIIRGIVADYISANPHRVAGFYSDSNAYGESHQDGQLICRLDFRRDTDSCDENYFHSIYVNFKTKQIVGDEYYQSSWCGY